MSTEVGNIDLQRRDGERKMIYDIYVLKTQRYLTTE